MSTVVNQLDWVLSAKSDCAMLERYSNCGMWCVVIQYLGKDESLHDQPYWFLRQFLWSILLSETQ